MRVSKLPLPIPQFHHTRKVTAHRLTVSVRVVEHLYRALTWDIASSSSEYKKTDSHTIEFPVTIAPDEEKTISYTAHYTW